MSHTRMGARWGSLRVLGMVEMAEPLSPEVPPHCVHPRAALGIRWLSKNHSERADAQNPDLRGLWRTLGSGAQTGRVPKPVSTGHGGLS